MQTNKTKARIKAGEPTFGLFTRYADPTLAEVLSYQPWDFIVFDGEHATTTPADVENLTRAAELHDVTPIARATTNDAPTILRLLDTGIAGVQIPWIQNKADAEKAMRAVKYYPRGARGLAGVRANDYGQSGVSYTDYISTANAEILTILQVESAAAVDALPGILEVEDIDVIFIGPTDLSQSVGQPGKLDHPDVAALINRIFDAVLKTDMAVGIMARDAASARQWRERGARYICISLESILTPAVREYLKTVRA